MKRRAFLQHGAGLVGAACAPWTSIAAAQPVPSAPAAARPLNIVVIGAGMAGMAAALDLIDAGHRVSIVEARARAGGRVYTIRGPFAEGLYAEAGAMQVFDAHTRVMHRIKALDVAIDPIVPSPHAAIVYAQGKRVPITPGRPVEWPYDLTPEERTLDRRQLWQRYVVPVLNDVAQAEADGGLPGPLRRYDEMTFTAFLQSRGASPAAIAILRTGLVAGLGDGSDRVSALNLLREAMHREEFKQGYTIRGGTDRLPLALAHRLRDVIRYGLPVVRIEQRSTDVAVICDRGGHHETLTADRVVCAIPFPLLRRIEVAPTLSPEKQMAVERLQYTSVTRVYLQTRTRFWLDEGFSGYAQTDLPIMGVYDRTVNQAGTRGILESYTSGEPARRLRPMSDRERVEATLASMRLVHPTIVDAFESGTSYCWEADEWARGGYAWFKPGEMTTLLPSVLRQEGRLHFAGDHASSSPGWMEGALESAERIVQEIARAS